MNTIKISFFISSDELMHSLRETLKIVKDIPHILKKFNSPSSTYSSGDWTAFLKSICSLLHVNKIFEVGMSENLKENMKYFNLDIVEKANTCITTELAYVYELVIVSYFPVIGVLDVSRSKEKSYETIVKEGFCEEVSSMELAQFPQLCKYTIAPCIVYIHQIGRNSFQTMAARIFISLLLPNPFPPPGYLLCIFEEKLDESTLEILQDFEFAFSDVDGDIKRFFYHSPKTRELDNLLGDIYHKILDMERAIIRDLVSHILVFSLHLHKAVDFAAELDCFLSLALIARQNNYVRPDLTADSMLDIKNGRHVLQEMAVDTFIPNDTKIFYDGRVNIITGPNYSGKSIYVKQVALIVFLSHIGSFVPAEAATVGLTDRIFCAMGSKHMTAEQSTFMIDLLQVGMMLRQATCRSLCLIDEFGKGTLTEDGIGLLGGTITHFASSNDSPKVLVCTHLTELINESFLPMCERIKFYNMTVIRPDNDCTENEDIVFLYRLVPGHALPSYGLHCALLAGVPDEVIKRAAFVLDAMENHKHVERLHNENLSAQDKLYQDAVDKLLRLDVNKCDLGRFFQDIFLS
ncbi:hypothetical protein Csa_010033 [Cucumis sativus]|nr:hypothetical protein Csa_010033 [Cucumis sativus]